MEETREIWAKLAQSGSQPSLPDKQCRGASQSRRPARHSVSRRGAVEELERDCMQKVLDFGAVCGMMVPIWMSGRAGSFFAGLPAPRLRINPANAQHTHLELDARAESLRAVASQTCLTPRNETKTNCLLRSQGWLIRATGSTMLRNTPTPRSIESKAVPNCTEATAPRRALLL